MGEFATMAGEILFAVFPQSDWGKLLGLAILGFFILVITGKFPPEWIGHGTRHVYRWLRCKVRDKHHFDHTVKRTNVLDLFGPYVRRSECRICGKVVEKAKPSLLGSQRPSIR